MAELQTELLVFELRYVFSSLKTLFCHTMEAPGEVLVKFEVSTSIRVGYTTTNQLQQRFVLSILKLIQQRTICLTQRFPIPLRDSVVQS